jgi:DNA-binding response OmpR family regulator
MPPRILLIEAHPDLQDLFSLALGIAGYDVAVADAWWRAAPTPGTSPAADLIVLDLKPYDDGPALCRRVKAAAARTPLVLLTTDPRPGARAACLTAGADRLLMKPVGLDALVATVGGLVDGAHAS